MKKTFILITLMVFTLILNLNITNAYTNYEVIEWICKINNEINENWEKLYWADFKINKLYFSFWDELFNNNCEWKNVSIKIEWIGKYNFNVIEKNIITTDIVENKINDDNNIDNNEAVFNTFLSKNKLSYSEKRKYIEDNKEYVYQELYEVLNILNEDVQYYESDNRWWLSETDVFTDETDIIELYKKRPLN